jgi:uncharacterized protein YaiL (DUF2058 family)
MGNAFQDQFLKAGLVTKQQVKKAAKEGTQNKKQQRAKKEPVVDETKLKAQQVLKEKAKLDRELNKRKEDEARNKAISAEINQLITDNTIARNDECDIAYNFEHNKKVQRIYINEDMRQKVIHGNLGIARIEGRYELVPKTVAEKIQQRNEKRVILFTYEEEVFDENDPYAEFKIPDDLMW